MKKLFLALTLFACACGTSTTVEAPPPAPSPVSVAPAPAPTVYVTASSVNVRRDPSMAGEVLKQAKKNEALTLLSSMEDWTKVQLADGTVGWVASRFVSQSRSASAPAPKAGCNTDFAFIKTPKPAFAEGESKHGLVVIDAYVSPSGDVTSTKVITNETGDPKLASMAESEIKSARFEAPKRGCVARAFIFTYKRSF